MTAQQDTNTDKHDKAEEVSHKADHADTQVFSNPCSNWQPKVRKSYKTGNPHAKDNATSEATLAQPETFGKTPCISPDEQCPPKKRGRKPKAQKEETQTRGRKEKKEEGKKRGRGRKEKKEEGKKPGRKAKKDREEAEECTRDRSKGKVSKGEDSPNQPLKRKRNKTAAEEHEEGHESKTSKCKAETMAKCSRSKQAEGRADTAFERTRQHLLEAKRARLAKIAKEQQDDTKGNNTGSKTKKDMAKGDNDQVGPDIASKPKTAKRKRQSKEDAEHTKDAKKPAKKAVTEKGKNRKHAEGMKKEKPKKVVSPEVKKRLSRKSAAYHRTFKATEGDEETKRAAAKKVI